MHITYEKHLTVTVRCHFLKKISLFIYFWLHWVFVAVRGLSLVALSRGYSWLRCMGFSLQWLLLLRSSGSRHAGSAVVARRLWSAGSVVVAHGLSCSAACGIFLDQGSTRVPCIGRRTLNHCATRECMMLF